MFVIQDWIAEGLSLKEAVKEVTKRIEGTYAVVAMSVSEPDKIVVTRDGNPLVIGRKDSTSYVSSDIPAFLPMTNNMILLLDGEIATLALDGIEIEKLTDGSKVNRETIKISWTADQAQKGGFPHFMLKEIHEQPEAIRNTLRLRQETLDTAGKLILDAERVFFLAICDR